MSGMTNDDTSEAFERLERKLFLVTVYEEDTLDRITFIFVFRLKVKMSHSERQHYVTSCGNRVNGMDGVWRCADTSEK